MSVEIIQASWKEICQGRKRVFPMIFPFGLYTDENLCIWLLVKVWLVIEKK